MKKILITLIVALTLATVACSPIEQKARDTSAALRGVIVAAQVKYLDACTADSTQTVCQAINKGVSGENALVTSIETYCGWPVQSPPADTNAKCVPVKSAEAGLTAAIANAAQLTLEIKGTL